jgi:hypothetical protein
MDQSTCALPVVAPRELIVIAHPKADLRVTDEAVISIGGIEVHGLNRILSQPQRSLKPLFGLSEERLRLRAKNLTAPTNNLPDASTFYRLYAPDEELEFLARKMLQEPSVEAAYIKPVASPRLFHDIVADETQNSVPTKDFGAFQVYLKEAGMGGIDAHFAWTVNGGTGRDVKIIDVESAWRFSHEDLRQNCGGVVGGTPLDNRFLRDHGTAVVGILGGDKNDFGITGICPEATVSAISQFGPAQGWGAAAAIYLAADMLDRGDILLLELQRSGPNSALIPVEWWPDEMVAIHYATHQRNVLVLTVGGNGGMDLDNEIYNVPPNQPYIRFDSNWHNPFKRDPIDSGSIIVGAGAAPPNAPGVASLRDRSRLLLSNYGPIFDAQGWGEAVATCGFGNMPDGGGTDEDFLYTDNFNGTSSAAPMVAGALACVQGVLKANGFDPLTFLEARALLRATGSPQEDDPHSPATNRIGNRPNLKEMIEAVL